MSNIDWLIRYEREGTKLDFKREQYRKEKYQDLIKDIMSMANTPVEGNRYIVVGVKDKPDGTKEFFSIPKDEVIDQATYQQIVRENIEPNIDFSYYTIELDGCLLGIIEINNCNNPPYMMKKDYKALKKGDCFIRRGSQQERLTRRDLDEILQFKSNNFFNDKISIGFNKNLEKKLIIKGVRELKFPSQEAKEKIESILRERRELSEHGLNNSIQFAMRMARLTQHFQSVPYEDRDTEELEKNLKNVRETYADDDWYYIGEQVSNKLNLIIRNDGNKYLEDVSIVLRIPSEAIMVMDKIHDEPQSGLSYLSPAALTITSNMHYPDVKEEDGIFVIQQDIGALKHQQFTEVFDEQLRVFFGKESINKTFVWSYTIYAKNLPNPFDGELTVEVV